MELFQVMEVTDYCSNDLVAAIISGTKVVFSLIQWGIPLLLIILCTIDMFKAMASGSEDKQKEVQKTCIRRLIYAVVAFLIPFIISLVFGFIGNVVSDSSATEANQTWETFFRCWSDNQAYTNGSENNSTTNQNSSTGTGLDCDPSAHTGVCYDSKGNNNSLNYCQCLYEFSGENYSWEEKE